MSKCEETMWFTILLYCLQTTSYFGKMWGNREVCYDVSLFTNEFHFGSLLCQLYFLGSITLQFSLRAHWRRFSSFFFQSIQLNLAGPVCSASHQNLTKFWLALPMYAWGLVFVKLECDHQPTADFLWLPQICWDSGEIRFLVAPFPPPLFKVFPILKVPDKHLSTRKMCLQSFKVLSRMKPRGLWFLLLFTCWLHFG